MLQTSVFLTLGYTGILGDCVEIQFLMGQVQGRASDCAFWTCPQVIPWLLVLDHTWGTWAAEKVRREEGTQKGAFSPEGKTHASRRTISISFRTGRRSKCTSLSVESGGFGWERGWCIANVQPVLANYSSTGIPPLVTLQFIVLCRHCTFYQLKASSSTSKNLRQAKSSDDA